MEKQLRKSQDKMLLGVCGGLAEYFNIDPSIVRIILALFTLLGGSGILLYIILAIIMKPAI
ncbi:PspC domain-containing protein [Acidaminobacter sp. JC074]|uniref:PspC domain-containing protein n=1 Tax=Acidaminobacter sp. JC074 TaxID=2530199 RepID=UPI001F0D2982|nr:PspC domain-containing protein [Acidaminobacter sp. JC074]MCH4890538.1 PspC domain-containing protein [Acidaminobacter sp. JC074]